MTKRLFLTCLCLILISAGFVANLKNKDNKITKGEAVSSLNKYSSFDLKKYLLENNLK